MIDGKLDPDRLRGALLVEAHRVIEEVATSVAANLRAGRAEAASYPPNGGLTDTEREALSRLKLEGDSESALRKIVADAAAAVLFQIFCVVDGVADPESFRQGWPGLRIRQADESDAYDPFWHDDFLESYWVWRRARPNPGWRLDLLREDEGLR